MKHNFTKLLVALLTLVALQYQAFSTAKVQVIHNAADPAAALVDLYINGETKLDDVAFRDATGYLEIPAGVEIAISVNGSSSTASDDQNITTINFDPLEEGGEYILIANGVVGDGFDNPSMERSIAFDIYAVGGAKTAMDDMNFDLKVWHGSTDAPAVDIYANGGENPLVPGLDYANEAGFLNLPAGDYNLTLNVAGTDTEAGTWLAPVSSDLLGQTGIILASGFLSPDNEGQTIPESHNFDLILVLNDGTVLELAPVVETPMAYVQVIHNAADPAAALVDLYVNGDTKLDDVAFRDATGYLEIPAGVEIAISVNGSSSTASDDQNITTINFDPLEEGGEYILIANGVVGDGFDNPSMERSIAFDIYAVGGAKTAMDDMNFDLKVWHGSTDAPAVDIYANGGENPLVPGLDYANEAGFLNLPAGDYNLTLNVAGTDTEAGTWLAPVSSDLLGQTGIILASGFLSPDNEGQTIPESHFFELILVLNNGEVIELPVVTNIEENNLVLETFPNPTSDRITINAESFINSIEVFSSAGEQVLMVNSENIQNNSANFDTSFLTNGVFYLRVDTEDGLVFKAFVKKD